MSGGGVRAGSCADADLEKYLISTVDAVPLRGGTTSGGISPRLYQVTPSSSNRQAGVDVRIEGLIRGYDTLTTAPGLSIKSMDLGVAPTGYSFGPKVESWIKDSTEKGYFGTGGNADIFLEIAKKRGAQSALNKSAAVPRFGIKRTSYQYDSSGIINDIDYIGVTTNFEQFGAALDANVAGSWTVVGQPRFIEGNDGVMYMFHAAIDSSGNEDVVVSKFDPKTDFEFSLVASLYAGTSQSLATIFNFSDWSLSGTVDILGVAPVKFGETIYCIVCLADTASLLGYLCVLEFRSDVPSIVPVYSTSSTDPALEAKVTPIGLEIIGSDDINVDSPHAQMDINPLTRFGGIDAIAFDEKVRVAVGVKCPGFCSEDKSRTVVYMDSANLNDWSDGDDDSTASKNQTAFALSVGGWNKTSGVAFNDLYRESTFIIACGNAGTIYKSTDGGASWVRKITGIEPEYLKYGGRINLFAVEGDGSGTIYAGGSEGIMIKSTDSGETWKVCRNTGLSSRYLYTDVPDFVLDGVQVSLSSDIRGIAVKDANTLWCCGDGGFVSYSSTGGNNPSGLAWTTIVAWSGPGGAQLPGLLRSTYTSICHDASNTIFVGGTGDVHSTVAVTNATHKASRCLRIENATSSKSYGSSDLKFLIPKPTSNSQLEGSPVIKIKKFSAANIVAIDQRGFVYKWNSSTLVFDLLHRAPVGVGTVIDFDYESVARASILATSVNSGAYILRNGGSFDLVGATYRTIAVDPIISPTAISMESQDAGVIVGSDGAASQNQILYQRARPRFALMPDGKLRMLLQNFELGTIEDHEFVDGSSFPKFIGVASLFKNDSVLTTGEFDPTKGLGSISTHQVTFDEANNLILTHYDGNGQSTSMTSRRLAARPIDGYAEWVSAEKGRLVSLPLGTIPTDGTNYTTTEGGMMFSTRDVAAFSRGRIFSCCVKADKSDIAIFAARDFKAATSDNPTNFVPIIPGKWQWSGINDIMVRFSGNPLPGDTFTAQPTFSYPTSNIQIESPSLYWLSGSDIAFGGTVQLTDIVYDAGANKSFGCTAAALFGINFRRFFFDISSDGTTYTPQVEVAQNLQSGTATGPGGAAFSTSFIDTSSNMIPSQYKAGASRTYYFEITSGTSAGRVFKILDNDRSVVYFENQGATIPTGSTYIIFQDRAFADLTSLVTDSQRARSRFARIRIPSQKTSTGNFKIGTAIIGRYVTYDKYQGNESRRRFSEGFGWRPVPSSVLQRGDSGVSSVEHLGFQRAWTLPYEQMQWWDRDMHMNGLMPAMRQAFAVMFDGSDETSLYLVRLTDGPESTNTFQDRYSFTYQLEEVI